MREQKQDMWNMSADAICITTNGSVRKNGRAIMGRGVALQARERFPGIDEQLGNLIESFGNHVHLVWYADEKWIVSFPTKESPWHKSDTELIKRSAEELVELTNRLDWKKVVLPRPGCNNGGLKWEEVKPILEPILDDRFIIVYL